MAEHHQLEALQADIAAQLGEGSEQQVHPLARVFTATHGAEQK